jgi:phosphohistidine phosphatase
VIVRQNRDSVLETEAMQARYADAASGRDTVPMDARRLYLLRHAKSSWSDPSLLDEQRPLSPRGRRAVGLLRKHFNAIKLGVDVVLCSPAMRTRETWAGVAGALGRDVDVRVTPAIYDAAAGELLDLVRGLDEGVRSALLVGHNPGIEGLAIGLVHAGDEGAMSRLGDGYPTGGFATISFECTWKDMDWRVGYLADFVRPRDLSRG